MARCQNIGATNGGHGVYNPGTIFSLIGERVENVPNVVNIRPPRCASATFHILRALRACQWLKRRDGHCRREYCSSLNENRDGGDHYHWKLRIHQVAAHGAGRFRAREASCKRESVGSGGIECIFIHVTAHALAASEESLKCGAQFLPSTSFHLAKVPSIVAVRAALPIRQFSKFREGF